MSKFNKKATLEERLKNHPEATVNHEGGLAFKMPPELELYSTVVTCLMFEPKFYESGNETYNRIKRLIQEVAQTNPKFILQLATYTRNEMYLRSVSTMLLVEAANIVECKPFVRQYAPRVIKRADEIIEALAYQLKFFGKPIPNSLKKGLADAFNTFDEYEIAKYNRDGEVTFSDAIRLVHPVPKDEAQNALFNYIRTGEIKYPHLTPKLQAKKDLLAKEVFDDEAKTLAEKANATWEVLISKFGSNKETWETVTPMMGYMAKLRNLRNFLLKNINIEPVVAHLTNKNAILNSKQLPFRFLSAYKTVENIWQHEVDPIKKRKILDVIHDALDVSVNNIPVLPGTTAMFGDNSASMVAPISTGNRENDRRTLNILTRKEVSNLMMAIAHKAWSKDGNVITGVFGSTFSLVDASRRDSVLTNAQRFSNTHVGYATNAYLSVKYLRENKIKVDRIFIFSDMQVYQTSDIRRQGGLAWQVEMYRREVNPDVYVYSFDLAGYGTNMFPSDSRNTLTIAGFSEKIFDFISLFESDHTSAVERIMDSY